MISVILIVSKTKNMSRSGPIIIIEDDNDDKQIFENILSELEVSNTVICFENTTAAFDFLLTTDLSPFIIFSDINLPGKNGLDFKKEVDEDETLRKKCIPFLFYSTSTVQRDVNQAYTEMTVQGFFQKGTEYSEMKAMIKIIIDYWKLCKHPNT